jgi:uncharacterized protein (UPF0332 family)
MNAEALAFWERAKNALHVAQNDLSLDSDAAASRAYYAAFYAVSAYFAMLNRTFTRHTAVESAVHKDLVKPGIWPQELGAKFSRLSQLRAMGDYGGEQHVDPQAAAEAVNAAQDIINTVAAAAPAFFAL